MKVFTHHNTVVHLILNLCLCVVVLLAAISVVSTFIPMTVNAQASDTVTPTKTVAAGQVDTGGERRDIGWETRLGQYIGYTILELASKVTWVGGKLLEGTIDWLVLDMGNKVNTTSIGGTIDSLWTLIRDICNLAFIFGFVYIGIRTIIDSDSSHVKSMLAQIVVGALLINFSLFIVKFVIDASNYVAVAIYNSMTTGEGSISAKFAELMGISTYFKSTGGGMLANLTTSGAISFYVMGSVLFMVAGFVFAAGAVLLIIRFVALIFIMIFSPILFAAIVFPGTAQHAKKLWSLLINYALFAPAYLLLLLISIRVLEGVTAAMNVGPLSQALQNGGGSGGITDSFGVVISFLISIFFLIMSLQIAKQFGIAGGDKAVSIGNDLRNRGQKMLIHGAGNATFGVAAAGTRATLGRGAHALSKNDWLKDRAAKGGLVGDLAYGTLKGSKKVADSSLDIRAIGGVGKAIGAGEGRKGGYVSVQKEINEKVMERANTLELDDTDKQVKERKDAMEKAEKELTRDRGMYQRIMNDSSKTLEQREEARKKIEGLEKTHKEAQEHYHREKHRRTIGSAANIEAEERTAKAKKALASQKDHFKKMYADWDAAQTDADREAGKGFVENARKELAKAEKEYKEAFKESAKNQGYAGYLQGQGFISSFLDGRLPHRNHKAGEELRKEIEKKMKKTKEDSRHEELVKAAKAGGGKKDDH